MDTTLTIMTVSVPDYATIKLKLKLSCPNRMKLDYWGSLWLGTRMSERVTFPCRFKCGIPSKPLNMGRLKHVTFNYWALITEPLYMIAWLLLRHFEYAVLAMRAPERRNHLRRPPPQTSNIFFQISLRQCYTSHLYQTFWSRPFSDELNRIHRS